MPQQKILSNWLAFFDNRGVSPAISEKYLIYVSKLLANNAPIIFDFNHLALLLGRQRFYLSSVVNGSGNHYTQFKLKKRSKGYRDITIPFPALLDMQYWIFENILKSISINPCAHGFAHKKSIITNSKIHAGQKHLLKLDLKDFFPSININRVIAVFKKLGYPNEISFYLAAICTNEGCLPQGAPTSPMLSNIIAKKLDKRLIGLAKKYKLRYTRYADDLTFSGDEIPAVYIEYVNDIIKSEGFELNSIKTRLFKGKGKRIVTGVSVIDKEIKLPREYKRDLRQELHFVFKYGLESHVAKKRIRKVNYLDSLIGKVNFWLMIEPTDAFALQAKEKLMVEYRQKYMYVNSSEDYLSNKLVGGD